MSSQFVIKQKSTWPPLEATLLQAGEPIDLSDATVHFVLARASNVNKIYREAEIVGDATEGNVKFDWQEGDVEEAGVFYGEFHLDWGAGRKAIVPSKEREYILVQIGTKLDKGEV